MDDFGVDMDHNSSIDDLQFLMMIMNIYIIFNNIMMTMVMFMIIMMIT